MPSEIDRQHQGLVDLKDRLTALITDVETWAGLTPLMKVERTIRASLLPYIPLVTVLGIVLTALFAHFFYEVDFFENSRNVGDTKKVARFYVKLGDSLLYRQEWSEATRAYQDALKIDQNNLAAHYGIAKADVFAPLDGQRYFDLELAERKLANLRTELGDKDFQVDFLYGIYFNEAGAKEQAAVWFLKAVGQNPDFGPGYLELGILKQAAGQIPDACNLYRQASEADPGDWRAKNNLGYCLSLTLDFHNAEDQLLGAYGKAPRVGTLINLANAQLFYGDAATALTNLRIAASLAEDSDLESSRILASGWLYSFHPTTKSDVESWKSWVRVNSLSALRAFLQYEFSLVYAVSGDFEAAEKAMAEALRLDARREFTAYFASKTRTTESFAKTDTKSALWLQAVRQVLGYR